jgi:two-component system, cell cycle sensor histidine kinase and response regulator CckA
VDEAHQGAQSVPTLGAAAAPPTALLDRVLNAVGVGLCLLDAGDVILSANREWLKAAQVSCEEAVGRKIGTLPAFRDSGLMAQLEEVRAGRTVVVPVHRESQGGRDVWYQGRLSPVQLSDGVGVLITAIDVTERKRAEQALFEAETHFRVAFQTSPDAININRLADGAYVAVNEGFSRLLGFSETEVLGKGSLELNIWVNPADRARLVAGMTRDGFVHNFEADFRAKDGRVLSGLMSARLVKLGEEDCILSFTRDIGEFKRAEADRDRLAARLNQAAKMEAIGQLAGGVAHDFNNLLTVILSCSSELKQDLEHDRALDREDVEEIHAAAERARDLTRQLLAFARQQVADPVALHLNGVVQGSQKLLTRLLGEHVNLRLSLEPHPWTIHGDPGHLEQVILNLALNARDAMPRGGTLTLETRNATASAEEAARDPDRHAGEWVQLVVSDTGIGMPEEVKRHIFEPFFTTKGQGQGTGLGLATVYGLVDQAGGHLHVESEPGEGTAFTLCFPRIHKAPAPPPREPVPTVRGGSETVLVVEDEPLVRDVTVRALRAGGYEVVVAGHPQVALDLSLEALRRVRLLVTDMVMPGIDGRALSVELVRRNPALRVLYVSGYTHDNIVERGLLQSGVAFLAKPFTGALLLAKVRSVLDAAR